MTFEAFAERLMARAIAAEVSISARLTEQLFTYFDVLAVWNRKINLTSVALHDITTDGMDRLFIEPVSAARFSTAGIELVDIGSGGGSPAIPFALATEARHLTMVESRTRKSVFLREAARAVQLHSSVVTARFEDVVPNIAAAGSVDIVTIRAVRVDVETLERLSTLLRPAGRVFLFQNSASDAPEAACLVRHPSHRLTQDAVLNVFGPATVPRETIHVS